MTEAEFIRHPEEWPRWPVLPLKHLTRPMFQKGSIGFLIEEETPPYKVYLGYIYLLGEFKPSELPQESFDTIEALLKEWRID